MKEPHFDNAIPDFVRMTTATELRAILAKVGYAGLRAHYRMLWDDGMRPVKVPRTNAYLLEPDPEGSEY